MKKALILIATAILALASCSKDDVSTELALSSDSAVTVPADGETVTVTFTTNTDWTASFSEKNWASINPTSGSAGTCTVKVSFLKNSTEDERTAKLTVTAAEKTATVNFTQCPQGKLALSSEATQEVSYRDTTINVKVLSNVSYTASANVSWITIGETKAATEKTTAITIAKNSVQEAREGVISFISEDKTLSATVTVKQGAFEPYFTVSGVDASNYLYSEKAGGTFKFTVDANVDFEIKKYDATGEAFDWAPVTMNADSTEFTFTVSASEEFDARVAYVKFTVPAIQVAVLDDNNEPTGETTPYVTRVYLGQEGTAYVSWKTDFTWDLHYDASSYTTALFGDYMVVSNANGLFGYNKSTGAAASLGLSQTPQGITMDDAGNYVMFTGGNYPLEEGTTVVPLNVFYITPADLASGTKAPKKIITYTNGFYGYGLDNLRVSGDITGNALVTMVSAGGWAGGTYVAAWKVENGSVATNESNENVPAYNMNTPWTTEIWASRNFVAKHRSANVSDGVFGIGYDGNYNLHYCPDMNADNWKEVFVTGSTWAEGYNAMDMITWNGSKYLALIGMTYFGKTNWGDDTAEYSYLPSYLFLLNIDDPENPVLVSKQEMTMTKDLFVYGATSDVKLAVEDGNLAAYVVDSGISLIYKMVYPSKAEK
ncbi:MAG: BACON domain-containing protein [Bacteroidales bacterium]|nr:BACON domain-containing protein [Bacteroidales bacterium]